ncbi:1,2-phenylacetyl-CoA epoxidase subunit PaaD [Nitriliruptor alkaliphilus]|uniref:1,2-phenylacetyl-CoA epoxidase subunit PaaD n=1 Tax=Nitriliruptor alkaliphilus TaxID=427918 RepID=UPI001B80203A|nr:1,2-phenylacetyl-CoA epoxidase subunit PaaD [Nitriliruptor alkaliphilus]
MTTTRYASTPLAGPTATGPDVARVRAAIADVPDPELPPVTIGMLGMLHELDVDGGHVYVELLPTFAGCPATDMIERDVVAAASAVPGVDEVTVRFRFNPPWTPDRIDAVGRERLREFGIAPPGGATGAPAPDGRVTLPLMLGPASDPRPCPYCGSADTVRESNFGPTPCRDVRFCDACQQPFEAFKA